MATVAEINGKLSLDATSFLTSVGKAQSSTKSLETALGNLTSALTSMENAVTRLSAQIGNIDAPARRSSEGIRQMGDSAQRTASQTQGMNATANESHNVLGRLGSMMGTAAIAAGGMFAAFAGYKVMAFAKDAIIGFNSTLESSQMMMGRMLGSEQKATTFINDLKEFAIQTPFQFQDLIKASQQFMVYGWNPDNIIRDMETIGSAAMGDKYKIDMITRALGQMKAKGRVSSEEISMQLGESGIPGWRYVAEYFGVTIPEAMKLAEKNALNVDETIQAILAGMQRDFGGGMLAASKTFQGAMSNVKDAAQQALAEGFHPLFSAMSAGLLKLANLMMSDKFQGAVNSLKGIAEDLAGPLTKKINEFIGKLENLDPGKAVDKFKDMTENLNGMKEMLGPIVGLLAGFKLGIGPIPGLLVGFIGGTKEGRAALMDLGKSLGDIAKDVAPDLANILKELTPLFATIARVVALAVKAFAGLPGPIKTAVVAAGILYLAFAKFKPLLSGLTSSFGTFTNAANRAAQATQSGTGTINGAPVYGPPTPGQPSMLSQVGSRVGGGMMIAGLTAAVGTTAVGAIGGQEKAQQSQGIIGGMSAGAGLGFMVGGPLGALVGAGVGGVAGIAYEELIGKRKRAEEASAAHAEAMRQEANALRQLSAQSVSSAMPDFYEKLGVQGENAFTGLAAGIINASPHMKRFERAAGEMGISMFEVYAALGDTHGRDAFSALKEQLGLTDEQAARLSQAMPELGRAMNRATEEATRNAIVSGDVAKSDAIVRDSIKQTYGRLLNLRDAWKESGKSGYDFDQMLLGLKNHSSELTYATDIATTRIYRQSGSYIEARNKAEEMKNMLADHLVVAMGISRLEADLLASSIVKIPTKKIIQIELDKKNFDKAIEVASQDKFIGVSNFVNFRKSVGLDTSPQMIAEESAKYDEIILKIIRKGELEQGNSIDQLKWLEQQKQAHPELMAMYADEIHRIVQKKLANMNGAEDQLAYLERIKTANGSLAPSLEGYERAILNQIVNSGKAKDKIIEDLNRIKEQYPGLASEVQTYIDKLNEIPPTKTTVATIQYDSSLPYDKINQDAYAIVGLSGGTVDWAQAMKLSLAQWAGAMQGFLYAKGGRVASGGGPIIVGEEGPEVFFPGMSGGYVVPNNKLPTAVPSTGAGSSMTVGNITIHVNGAADPVATAREVRKELLKTGQRNGSVLGRYA